jgi:hypothetical protein
MTKPYSGRVVKWLRHHKVLSLAACAVAIIAIVVPIIASNAWTEDTPNRLTNTARYVGVHVQDAPASYYGVEQFAGAIGTQPNIVSYYSPWLESFQADFAASAEDHGAITVVQIDPKNVSLASVVLGEYDGYLRSYAAAVKAFGGHIIISFGHEMNGNWYSWGYKHTSPKVFIAAWRHIVSVFRSVGAGNVSWLWTVNVVDNNLPVPIPDPSPWWPGPSYVTWVGIDGYYYNSSTSFASLFGPTIVSVRQFTNDPILIAETGADISAGQPAKIRDLFDGVETYGLLGFMWFDENTEGRAWRISSPEAFASFGKGAKSVLVGHRRR